MSRQRLLALLSSSCREGWREAPRSLPGGASFLRGTFNPESSFLPGSPLHPWQPQDLLQYRTSREALGFQTVLRTKQVAGSQLIAKEAGLVQSSFHLGAQPSTRPGSPGSALLAGAAAAAIGAVSLSPRQASWQFAPALRSASSVAASATATSSSQFEAEAEEVAARAATQESSRPRSMFWQAAKLAFGLSAAATVGAIGYVTYAFDIPTVRVWLEERRSRLASTNPAVLNSKDTPVSIILASPAQIPAVAEAVLLDLGQMYVEAREDAEERLDKFRAPPSDKLLPDQHPAEQSEYTLVLDLEGTLVKHDWKRDRGYRVFKRPGAEAFLERMGQFYEVVVFSDDLNIGSDPILDRLDTNRTIRYRLHRDSTQYTKGHYVKDLSKLNRDPKRVLYITAKPESALQKGNMVVIPEWKVDTVDTTLLDHLPFLECLSRTRPSDVRAVLASYEGQDIPPAFKERAKEYQKQMQERRHKGFFGLGR